MKQASASHILQTILSCSLIVAVALLFTVTKATAQFIVTPSTNCSSCDGQATFNTMIPGSVFFLWSDAQGLLVFSEINDLGISTLSGLCAGVLQVVANDGAQSETYILNIPTLITNPGTALTAIVCSTDGDVDPSDFIPDILNGGTWTEADGTALPGSIDPSVADEGYYLYNVDEGGCTVTTGIFLDIIQDADPGFSTTYLICENYQPFLMTDFLSGTPDYTGQWFAGGGIPMDGIFDPATMNTALFTYMIDTVVGCSPVFSTMLVVENLIPDPGLDASVLVCADAIPFSMLGQLSGNPQPGGQWYDQNDNAVSGTFDPAFMPVGIYQYIVNGATPCVGQDSYLTIDVSPTNPSGTSAIETVCESDPEFEMISSLGGTPLDGGVWTNSLGTIVSPTIDPATATPGIYTYEYPSIGCVPDFAELTVTVEQLPDAGNSSSLPVCESLVLFDLNNLLSSNADPDGTWFDSNGIMPSADFNFPGLGSFPFSYLSEGIFCPSDVAVFTLTVDALPSSLTDAALEVCEASPQIDLNQLANANGELAGWEDDAGNAVTALFEPITAGTFPFTGTIISGNSCPDEEAIVTIEVAAPDFESTVVSIDLCQLQSNYELTNADPMVDFTIGTWTDANANPVPTSVALDFSGTESFFYTSSQTAACFESVLEVQLNVFEPMIAGNDLVLDICSNLGEFSMAELAPAGSTPGGIWTFSGTEFSAVNFNPSTDESGTYVYAVSPNGPCAASSADVMIAIQQEPVFDAGEDIAVCHGSSSVELGQVPQASFLYEWEPQINLSNFTVSNPVITLENTDDIPLEIEYVVYATNGICETTDTIIVAVYPLPDADAGNDTEMCAGDTIQLNVSGGNEYYWLPADFFSDNTSSSQTISPQQNMMLMVEVMNQWECVEADSVSIIVHSLPFASFEISNYAACPPALFEVVNTSENSPGIEYEWLVADQTSLLESPAPFQIVQPGNYDITLIATNEDGCAAIVTENDVLVVFENPIADFSFTPQELTALENAAQFVNESHNAELFFWSFDALGESMLANPEFTFPAEGEINYFVCLEVGSSEGCSDTLCNTIHIESATVFYAPNAFTPDGDGINDVFIPAFEGFDVATYTLQIFDRWGEVIFETNVATQPWIGNVHGGSHFAQSGVYLWQAKIKDADSAEYSKFSGHITLIR